MTLEELDTLLEDTRKLPRAADSVQQHMAIAIIEVARQLMILNQTLAGSAKPKAKVKMARAS